MQYPLKVRKSLLKIARYFPVKQAGAVVFNQGDYCEGYYVIVRGTVKVEEQLF